MADGKNDVVLSFNDSLVRQSDIQLLDGPHWLNDIVIGFCFEYFEREKFNHSADKLALISPDVAQFIKLASAEDLTSSLESLNLPTKQFVFLPVNDNENSEIAGGSHWSLLVYIRSKQEFRHYDSCSRHNEDMAKKLAYKLQPHVHAPMGRMKFIEMDGPQQENSYDCGVYVISTAEHLCRELCEGYSINLNDLVTQESINEKRKLIKDLVYQVADEFGS